MTFTTVLDAIPKTITAGESISWRVSLADYPASSSWVLIYTLINADNKITITATADGVYHLIEIDMATSGAYAAGEYEWQAHVSNGVERYKVGGGLIVILVDFAAQAGGYDSRSHVKRILDALEAAMDSRASKTQLTQTVGGVQVQYMTHDQLSKARDEYQRRYDRAQLKAGRKRKRTIKPRFTS